MKSLFGHTQPALTFEPGRSLVSDAQLLLISVEYVKQRGPKQRWLITDGGLGTVSMPTWYEYHEVFPCRGVSRRAEFRTHIMGPGCFAADIVYKNKPLPPVAAGEVLAVMDSGAYFLALESNFGHPRPAVVGAEGGDVSVLRRRESCADMMMRDTIYDNGGVS
jgi:diaminopimelate decarboxylase